MKKILIVSLLIILSASACRSRSSGPPTGTWKYRLLVNGAPIGSAVSTNSLSGGKYVSTVEMEMDAGYVKNSTRQVVTETTDFKPLKLEVYNKTVQNGQENELKTIAVFKGARVDLDTGDAKSTITISKPFILEGNYFMKELMKSGFKAGTVVRHHVYEPTVDIEEPVLMIIRVIGTEEVTINGATKSLIHLGYAIENMKNIDAYVDSDGITHKMIITMLNNRLEMILK